MYCVVCKYDEALAFALAFDQLNFFTSFLLIYVN